MPAKFNVQANLNPYAPPTITRQVDTRAAKSLPNAEPMRKEHLATESAIAAFGWFHIVIGILTLVGVLGMLVAGVMAFLYPDDEFSWLGFAIGLFMNLSVGAWEYSTGVGLKKLDPKARVNATILNIFNIPIGVGIWYFILAWSEKANTVFSDNYREIVAQTPNFKRHMTGTAWLLILLPIGMFVLSIGLLILLGVLAVFAASQGAA